MARTGECPSLTEGLFYNGQGLRVLTTEEMLAKEEKWRVFHEKRGAIYEPTAAYIAFTKDQNQKSKIREKKARGRARAQVRHPRRRSGDRTRTQDPLQTLTDEC